MVKLTLEKVLVADPVDSIAVELLKRKNVQVDVNTGLSEAQLIQVIPVSTFCLVFLINFSFTPFFNPIYIAGGNLF